MDNFSIYINYVEKLKETEINFTEIDLAPEINKKLIDNMNFDSKIRKDISARMVSKLISNEDIYKEDLVRTLARFGLKDIDLIWFQGFTINDKVRFIKFINSALEKENKGLEDHTDRKICKEILVKYVVLFIKNSNI